MGSDFSNRIIAYDHSDTKRMVSTKHSPQRNRPFAFFGHVGYELPLDRYFHRPLIFNRTILMHLFSILHVFGTLFMVTGISMLLPLVCSLIYREGDFLALLVSAAFTLLLGLPLWWLFRKHHDLGIKDGIFIAVFGWILVSALCALPFMIHGSIPSFTDAFFEMMSGYTTTGATILTDIEVVPHGLLFWRSQTHLLGGMGFLTLTVIFLPHGMGGLRIFRAESSPGQVITKEKFHARNRDTMIRLWVIYLVLNLRRDPAALRGRHVAVRRPVPRLRHGIHLRLLPLERQHRALQQRLFRLGDHSFHVSWVA